MAMRGSHPSSAASEAVPGYARTNHILGSGEREIHIATRIITIQVTISAACFDINT
jgi:hypothetical protein